MQATEAVQAMGKASPESANLLAQLLADGLTMRASMPEAQWNASKQMQRKLHGTGGPSQRGQPTRRRRLTRMPCLTIMPAAPLQGQGRRTRF